MKVKITVEDYARFELACEANDAKIVEMRKFGKKTVVIVSIKSASVLYEVGKTEPFIDLEEINQVEKIIEIAAKVESKNPEVMQGLDAVPEPKTETKKK
jgi:hypothetical protein